MSRTRHIGVAAVVAVAMAVLAGCGGDKTDKLAVDTGPVASGNGITPANLTAQKGHEVEIKVTNTAKDKAHGFAIDEFGVKDTVDQGTTKTVKFKADKAGTYKVYCQLHPTHGTSQLVVS